MSSARPSVVMFLASSAALACTSTPASRDAAVDPPTDSTSMFVDARVDSGCDAGPDAMCGACATNTDCAGATPICTRGLCRACLLDSQCTNGTATQCREDGACVECLAPTDCPASSPICTVSGTCAECRVDADCPDIRPECGARGVCESCAGGSCTPAQKAQEIFALSCLTTSRVEGESQFGDALQAFFCGGRTELFPFFAYFERAIATGRIAVDEAALAGCRASDTVTLLGPSCFGLLAGTVPDGSSCGFDPECASGRCVETPSGCGGTCRPRVASTMPCEESGDCLSGLECISRVCTPIPGNGEPCTSVCADGHFCNATMRCEPRHPVSGSCRPARDGDCAAGLTCESRVCTAPPIEGAACRPEHQSPRCATGLRCTGGFCRTPVADGGACTTTTACAGGRRCVMSRCVRITGPGEPCTAASACPFATGCIDGRCSPLPDVGSPCSTDVGCFRGVCRDGRCIAEPVGTACEPFLRFADVLDPCGANATCTDRGASGWSCVAEVGPGAVCEGAGAAPCRAPDTYCAEDGRCAEYCLPN